MVERTALVTGASRGIGEAFARSLAGRGCDLVLVARDELRLGELADELKSSQGVEVEVLAADLADAAALERVADRLADGERPIDVLVNNAGFGTYGRHHELDVAGEIGMIDTNISALVRLTHAALESMVLRGRGGVLNVSSMGALQPSPTFAVYSATKSFVTNYSQAVREEVKDLGVNVCVLMPGFTRTEFQASAGMESTSQIPDWMWQSADEVAEAGLAALEAGKATVVPGTMNKAVAALVGVTPDRLTRRVASMVADRTG